MLLKIKKKKIILIEQEFEANLFSPFNAIFVTNSSNSVSINRFKGNKLLMVNKEIVEL